MIKSFVAFIIHNLKFITMKKILLSAAVLMSITAYAQKIRIGFTTGVAIANYKSKVDGNTESGNAKAGFTAGVLADIPAGNHLSFQPALNFVQKGTKDEQTYGGVTEKIKLNINCIELPLNFLYNSRGKNGNFFVGAGPSLAFAISGKAKYDDGTNKLSEKIKFGSGDEDFMKPVDLGANFIAGYTLQNGISFCLNYNAGLNNLFPHGSEDGRLRSNYFGIKIGYLLKGNYRN